MGFFWQPKITALRKKNTRLWSWTLTCPWSGVGVVHQPWILIFGGIVLPFWEVLEGFFFLFRLVIFVQLRIRKPIYNDIHVPGWLTGWKEGAMGKKRAFFSSGFYFFPVTLLASFNGYLLGQNLGACLSLYQFYGGSNFAFLKYLANLIHFFLKRTYAKLVN